MVGHGGGSGRGREWLVKLRSCKTILMERGEKMTTDIVVLRQEEGCWQVTMHLSIRLSNTYL